MHSPILENGQPEFRGFQPKKIYREWGPNVSRNYILDRKTENNNQEMRVSINLAGYSDHVYIPSPPKIRQIFHYSYEFLDNNGYPHKAPVANSPRCCSGDPKTCNAPGLDSYKNCSDMAVKICKQFKNQYVVKFTLRDEDRALNDVICSNDL